MTVSGTSRERTAFWGALALTALIYLPSLANYPVADSWVFLVPRNLAETAGYFARSVIPEEWNALWFRPLPMFTFWLDNLLWEGTGWGPHLTNLLIHLANAALVWHLVRSSGRRNLTGDTGAAVIPAFIATLVYGIHPLGVGAVAWIAARFDLMFVTFGLGALVMWERWRDGGKSGALVACLALLAGSLLSKEQGVVFFAVVSIMAIIAAVTDPAGRRRYLAAVGIAAAIFAVIFAWRLVIFQGVGGYLESTRMVSLRTPMGYLAALFWPYPNLLPAWRPTVTLALSVFLFGALVVTLWRRPVAGTAGTLSGLVIPVLIWAAGLATTSPHAGLDPIDIMGHIESRFALVATTGLALTLGRLLGMYGGTIRARRLALAVVGIWGVTALWRTDVQVAAWHASGETARQIVETAVREVPDPVPGSTLYFFGVPGFDSQYAYIFGIGLREALMRHYPGRTDFAINPQAVSSDLASARPGADVVFRFNRDTWMLERLYPQGQ